MYSDSLNKLRKLTAQLFPLGRSMRITRNSVKEKIVNAITLSEDRFVRDCDGVLDHILPDNDNFTVYDATLWETRLGLNTNPATDLEARKAAIIQKLNHPGNTLARQSAGYIEQQLQLAGFNVFVHENIPPQTIEQVLISSIGPGMLGDFQLGDQQLGDVYSVNSNLFQQVQLNDFQLGDFQLGQYEYSNKIANHIDKSKDYFFNYGHLSRTFFIGGEVFGSFANVDETREQEFRQLILQLKPARTVGFLLINYI